MNDNIWKRDEVDSPCVKLCVIHPEHKVCIGCFRTIAEIATWSNISNKKRLEIMQCLKSRVKLLKPKRRSRPKKQIKTR